MRKFALAIAIALSACTKGADPASTDAALQDCLGSWKTCVQHYTSVHRELPRDTAALMAWARENDAVPAFEKDPWSRVPEYRPTDYRKREFELLSLGEDGELGTNDDMIYRSTDDTIASSRKRYTPKVER